MRVEPWRDCNPASRQLTQPYAYIPSGYQPEIMPPNYYLTLSPGEIRALVNFQASVAT
jgi:hypothetical protein